ncbi:MAG: BspA family leucine-rich repeat surface protein, partial [Candidatus Nanoarchaeia archaeon]
MKAKKFLLSLLILTLFVSASFCEEVFEFGTPQEFSIDVSVLNADNTLQDFHIRITDSLTLDEIYSNDAVTDPLLLEEGVYDFEIESSSSSIKRIVFNDVVITQNISELLGIQEITANTNEYYNAVRVYAIDPTNIDFENANVSIIAQGRHLYKCEQWNFDAKECDGEWALFKTDLIPGQEYYFELTPEDPGYMELDGKELYIYDDTDESEKFVSESVTFYANYTDTMNNESYGFYCNISIGGTDEETMLYNVPIWNYTYESGFPNSGDYEWKVICYNSDTFEELLNTTDTVHISSNDFVSTWYTSNAGESNSTQIMLPLLSTGTYDFTAYWGDESSSMIQTYNSENITHTYASEGIYNVTIRGTIEGWAFNNTKDKLKLLDISNFGSLRLGNTGSYFYGCANLNITATDILDLNGTTTLDNAFRNSGISIVPSMNDWDVSNITNMNFMFSGALHFNQNISSWDTSKVSTMEYMFTNANVFNQNVNNWNISSVTKMQFMFSGAAAFNQELSSWDTSKVTDMSYILNGAAAFNQELSGWNTSSLHGMNFMFSGATSFNQDLNTWDTSDVTSMYGVFNGATSFNQDLSSWDTSNVITMYKMFDGATSFNQNLSSWDVSNVVSLGEMFNGVTLSTANYDSLLISWAGLPSLQSSVSFDAGNSKYCLGESARNDILIGNYNWSITDGGKNCIANAFVSTWNTSESGVSNSTQITLPLSSSGTYDFIVDWGDESSSIIQTYNSENITHTYASEGIYNVTISGTIIGWEF